MNKIKHYRGYIVEFFMETGKWHASIDGVHDRFIGTLDGCMRAIDRGYP
jgi:hypothetical protein